MAGIGACLDLLSRVLGFESPLPFASPEAEAAVKNFVGTAPCLLLRVGHDGKRLFASNDAATSSGEWKEGLPEAFLTKLRPCLLEGPSIAGDVAVSSAPRSALESLFVTLHTVYLPKLTKVGASSSSSASGGAGAMPLDDKLRTLLTDLDKNLHSALRAANNAKGGAAGGAAADSGAGILSVVDEKRYWDDAARSGSGKDAERANVFSTALETITPRFERLSSLTLPQILELVEDSQMSLDGLWRARLPLQDKYPAARMKRLLFLVGSSLAAHLQTRLGGSSSSGDDEGGSNENLPPTSPSSFSSSAAGSSSNNIWTMPSSEARAALRDAARICETWCSMVESLTGPQYWANSMDEDRPWTDGPFSDGVVKALRERITAVARVRLCYDETLSLVSSDAAKEAGLHASVALLRRRNVLSVGLTPQEDFEALAKGFERAMDVLEPSIADALRSTFGALTDSPQLLVAEAAKFPSILRRPKIRRALTSEREAIIAQLTAELSSLEGDLASRQATLRASTAGGRAAAGRFGPGATPSGRVSSLLRGRNESFALSEIAWAEAVRARVRTMASSATGLLSDLRAFKECVDSAKDLGDQLAKYQQDVFASWIEGTEAALRAGTLSLDASGRVVDFDRDGNIVVRYSEGMVTLVRDVRQLGEKGFAVPPRIRAAANEAEQLYRFGVQLQKVASFYNTLGAEIIPQQKPMLLEPLLAFEKLVQESAGAAGGGQKPGAAGGGVSAVTWSDPKRCSDFVEGLQRAADRLAAQNRRLRGVHARLCEEVAALMSVDMVRERDSWRAKWAACKEFIVSGVVKAGGYNLEQISKWLGHWDLQMYKVLEVGYRMGLESLNEQLQEIKVDLVFVATPAGAAGPGSPATASVVFKPSMEEVRAGYYREMKRFIGLPLVFDGFLAAATGSNAISSHIYSPMPSRNAACLAQVYRKAEIMFARLSMLKDKMKSWVALGAVDADAFVEARVRSVSEFEANFQVLKARRREADRLPDFQKVDCVSVNLAPFKAGLDAVFQRVNDALLLALRRILIENMRTVEHYLERGIEMMSVKPQSLADIAKAQKNWRELSEARGGMKALTGQSEEQRRLLAGMAAGVLDLSDVNSRLAKVLQHWDSFDGCLEAFTSMAEEQRGMLKGNVAGEVKEAQATIDRFVTRWQQLKPGSASSPNAIKSWSSEEVANIFTSLEDWTRQLEDVKNTVKQVQESCESFGLAPPQFDSLNTVDADVKDTLSLWQVYKQYDQERKVIASQDWITFRSKLFDLQDFAGKWSEAMAARQQAARPATGGSGVQSRAASGAPGGRDIVTARIIDETDGISKAFNALKFARGEPFREEHWTAMFKKLGLPSKTTRIDNLTVGMLLDVLGPLAANASWLKDLHSRAQGEVTIREALQEVKAWCETAEFKLMEHVSVAANGRKTPLIREWKDLFTAIGDNQSLLASLKDSPYFKPFADTAAVHEANLATVDECCQKLNAIQRRWVYLEPVFSRGALPSEQARFKRVDEDFRAVMGTIGADPRAASLADAVAFPNLKENLTTMLDQLERCQRALSDFLEERRAKFPRFYFLGDDDLLEILGQSQNPAVIQSHLKKLYQGVFRVEFADTAGAQQQPQGQPQKSIVSMCSSANEIVRLVEPVPVTEDVTVWLNRFTNEMVRTLANLLVECLRTGQQGEQWESKVARFPSQILCLAEQIKFCAEAEAALSSGGGKALVDLKSRLEAQLAAYTSKDTSKDTLMTLKVKALVLDTIHHLDVVDQLLSKEVKEAGAWMWQKQLRFYLDDKTGRAVAKMVDATVDYTYEYQGNFPKLVHTPLTDKCYMVLTQALSQGLGGNPYGPAGTGKTESVKALGAAIGRQVLVFNCDEGIDYTSFGRIFTGIVKCGAWGCFDEFNRLKEDQLSAISTQIQTIQGAIREKRSPVTLLGAEVSVNFHAGIFVTLNPAGKNYGGRSKLPDNLKQLFRPVAMTKPDNELIAEVILYSEGFRTAKELGKKVVSLFNLSSELLSSQNHYDWGLRSMKTVLNTGGSLIQKLLAETAAQRASDPAAAKSGSAIVLSPQTEKEVLIKAIRVNTLSKLTFEDTQRFLGLMSDIFPGIRSEDVSSATLEAAIKEVMASKQFSLEFDEGQLRKMLQLKEALDQRIGCLVVGPSGCGKSALWRVLQAALIKCGQQIVTHVMNPKAMPRSRLLGEMDHDTREWTDGVLTAAARQVVKEPPEVRSWIVCDGDVDPEWIESLNSVLDDNHLLTLPNGERIAFGANVNFLFETHDLKYASPATISRMGMIYMSDDDVDVRRVIKRWLGQQQPEEAQTVLAPLIESLFMKALDWVRRAPKAPVVDTTLVGTVVTALSHLNGSTTTKADFAVALIRGFGANFDVETRTAFAKEVFAWCGTGPDAVRPVDPSAPLDCYSDGGILKPFTPGGRRSTPAVGADSSSSSTASGAGMDVEGPRTPQDVLAGAVVPTVSLQRTAAILAPWLERMEPFILVGPEGCGKSMLIRHLVEQRRTASITYLHCNAQTSAEHVINKIRQLCVLQSSTSGRVYRPREGDRLVLFLKDINLPKPDKYGTCSLVAFLQQLLTFHGFYDENREFLGIERVHIVASMNPSTTIGRHVLSPRFTATVRLAYMDYPDTKELAAIYGNYMSAAFGPGSAQAGMKMIADERFRGSVALSKVASTMVEIHQAVLSKFSVDEHRHYMFTPRDLTSWVKGMMRYALDEEPLLEVLAYEAMRIYRDRLVDSDSAAKFDSAVSAALRSQWGFNPDLRDVLFTSLTHVTRGAAPASARDGPSAASAAADAALGTALHRVSFANLRALVDRGKMVYEREERELGIHLFNEVVEHVACIDRIVTASGGCALLVGRSGVGRRSAASLVAHMRGMTLYSPSVGRGYGVKTFFQDLKTVLATAGVQGEDIVLYLEDHHFTDDEVLESVNSLLASGEIPGLYTHEELEPLLSPLKELMSESVDHYRTPYDFFLHRIRKHLHVVIGMDSTHPEFLPRCERNPALYTRCTMVWMGTWKKSSLVESVPALLQDSLEGMAAFVPKELLVELAVAVHNQATISNPRGAAPRDLVALLRCFRGVYESKVGGSKTEVLRLRAGLTKLEEAQSAVDIMSKQAGAQREELKLKQAAADRAMTDITDALSLASDRKKEVEVLSDRLAVAEGETRARKGAVEAELAGVMPMIEAAKAAVGGIKKEHLDEIRNLRAPPDAVADVLSAVLTLLGINDTSWASMKKFLGERGVKDSIIGFDARKMTSKQRSAVNKVLKEKGNSFEKDVITRASFAAAPMAEWVKAVLAYADTLEKIAPLEGELQSATRALGESQAALEQNKRELDEIDVRVRSLRDDFGQRTAEAEVLKAALAKTEDTLHRAQSLLGELSGERDRWSGRVEELSRQATSLPLFALLGAGFITYLGGCSEDVRASSLQEWQRAAADLLSTFATRLGGGATKQGLALKAVADIMMAGANGAGALASGRFEPVRFLSSESEVLQWKAQGLPSDDLSVENAAVIINSTHSGRVPFIIDPSTQATAWLQHYLSSAEGSKMLGSSASTGNLPPSPRKGTEDLSAAASLEILNAQEPRFQNVVELAVRFGKTLLIKDVDRVEPMLYPLLRKDYYHAGPRSTVQVGDKQVDVNERFRVFFATRNPRPFIPPDAASVITEVNFTVTRSGLESQLLAVTIQHERPELESRKSALLAKEEELKLQLVGVEDSLLQALASSQGNLLEDKALLSSLAQAKAKASEISAALEGSEIATRELDTQRNVYRPFAAAGSTIFFALRDLQGLNNMYQFSLAFFLHLFKTTLSETRPNNNAAKAAASTPAPKKKKERDSGYEGKGGDDEDDAAREAAEASAKMAAEQDTAELSSMSDLSTLIASAPTPTPEAIAALIHDLEVRTLRSVGTSLLKDDRLMFAMHLVHSMHPAMFADSPSAAAAAASNIDASSFAGHHSPSQGWRFFLGEVVAAAGGGDGGSDSSGERAQAAMPRGFPLWAARDRASQFKALELALPDVVRDLGLGETDKWGRWATSSSPEKDFPPHSLKVTSPFHRLLLVHALRPDRALSALQSFLLEALKLSSLNPPPASMPRLASECSSPSMPILMITGTGADPSRELSDFAANTVGIERYREVAMGGGMQEEALRLLRNAATEGHWLCLKNLHLVVAWLPTLEKELAALKPHREFRLWLTTECHSAFPAVLLQSSLKATFEAPPGIRKNLERTMDAWGAETLCKPGSSPLRSQMLFALAWLHATVQERRTYVPQGWTKPYEFSFADLRAGASVIDGQLARVGGEKVPWAYIHGLIENTVYGGRVDNSNDLRVLRAYLATIFHPDVLKGARPVIPPPRNGGGGLALPSSVRFDDYAALVAALPETDAPYLFGLPDNIERSLQRVVAAGVIASIKSMRASRSSGANFNRDKWRSSLSPLLDLWDKLSTGPAAAILSTKVSAAASASAKGAAATAEGGDPVVSFVKVEHALACRLASSVHADLTALKKVLVGGGLLTPAVVAIGATLLGDAVPDKWKAEWDGPDDPLQWLSGLAQRCDSLAARWLPAATSGGAAKLLSAPVRLNELFRPATFLNAVRQQTARALMASGAKVAMDSLRLVSSWDSAALASAPLKATISGLLLQGATFSNGNMQEAGADAPEVQSMPDVTVAWVPLEFPDPIPAAVALTLPVYQNLDRSSYVMELALPCKGDKAKWVLAGISLFLSSN